MTIRDKIAGRYGAAKNGILLVPFGMIKTKEMKQPICPLNFLGPGILKHLSLTFCVFCALLLIDFSQILHITKPNLENVPQCTITKELCLMLTL